MLECPPDWFLECVNTPYESRSVSVDNCNIHYRYYCQQSKLEGVGPDNNNHTQTLVFVHGFSAQSHWWDAVAPFLLSDYNAVSLDLSGFGDSGWRKTYPIELHGREIAAVIADAGIKRPIIVAHSLGAVLTLSATRTVIDSETPLILLDPPPVGKSQRSTNNNTRDKLKQRENKYYKKQAEIVARFRFLHGDELARPYIKQHIAMTSVRQTESGWTWKFDPDFLNTREEVERIDVPSHGDCKRAVIFGQSSIFSEQVYQDYFQQRLGDAASFNVIPDSNHNIMIDNPLALVEVIRNRLNQWQRSN